MSVGDLKYKILLLRDLIIKKMAIIDTRESIAKNDALFLAFFLALTILDSFAVCR